MEAIFVLIPISIAIVFGSIFIFLWAVNNYQFDDLEKEAQRILQHDSPEQIDKGEMTLGESNRIKAPDDEERKTNKK